jgi:hypothetical protein
MNYRQGDVFLLKIKKPTVTVRQELKPHKDKILARGEATGHHHICLDGEVLVDKDGQLFFETKKPATIRHADQSGGVAEHQDLKIDPGFYRVLIERQYEPEGFKRVAD